jgi:ribonuclease Z
MTWLVQSTLVNEPFSDPGLFIDFRFGRRALLFDLGDLTPLSPRQLLRVGHAFVSHAHMDHFAGFDRLLRICLHRTTPLHLIGPAEFADRVEHKLRAYSLNLLDERSSDFVITAAEFNGEGFNRISEFRAREAFRRRDVPLIRLAAGTLLDEDDFRIDGAVLDHGIPCLAFAFEEKLRVNVWSEGLKQLKLPVGPWLNEAKRAIRRGEPDDTVITSKATCRSILACSDSTRCAPRVDKNLLTSSTPAITTKTSKESSHWRVVPISFSSSQRSSRLMRKLQRKSAI